MDRSTSLKNCYGNSYGWSLQLFDYDGDAIEKTDQFGFTRLMSACKNGSAAKVKRLLKSGVNIDQRTYNGFTALDICVIGAELKCMKILMDNGAEVDLLSYVMKRFHKTMSTSLQTGLEYLISLPSCPRAVKIQALELLGAACADDQSYRHLARGYWSRSLEERAKAEPQDLVQPKSLQIHPAYGNAREFQTVKELDRIASCDDGMWMQALIVRERIHGSIDVFVYSLIQRRATVYLSSGNFDRCMDLVRYIIEQPQKGIFYVSFHTVFSLLSDVMSRRCRVEDDLARFIKSIDLMAVILHPKRLSFVECLGISYNELLVKVVCCVGRFVTLLPSMSEKDTKLFHQALCKLMDRNPDGRLNHRLLRIAYKNCNQFPLFEFVRVLLKAGANPQETNLKGNTTLHLIARRKHPDKHRIIKLILSYCCQCVFNLRNVKKKLFTDYLPSEMAVDIKKPVDICSLRCLSAKAVVKFRIPCKSVLPKQLVNFVNIHHRCPAG